MPTPQPMPTIYLFDVDGTLITTGGVGRHAIERALEHLFDQKDACSHFSFGGMTDRGIFRRGLAALEQPMDEATVDRLLEAYLPILAQEVRDAETYRVHDGIRGALEALSHLEDVALGLGTGNVERGARIKLERVDLNRWFSFGGFGCDAEDRGELIARGAERGAERLGRPLERCRVIVVGDTPKDVQAARANGFLAFVLGTGLVGREDLERSEPDWLFDDLASPGALQALVGARALTSLPDRQPRPPRSSL